MKPILLILLLLSGCATPSSHLVGSYQSRELTWLNKAWKIGVEGYRGFYMGTQLALRPDASFVMLTCGNRLAGTWTRQKDTLYLHYQSNQWRNDSLQEFGWEGRWPPVPAQAEAVLIKGDRLVFVADPFGQNEGDRYYDVLEKEQARAETEGQGTGAQ